VIRVSEYREHISAPWTREVIGTTREYVTSEAITRIAIDGVAPIAFIIDGDFVVRQSIAR
jgi:hypothetical protein